MGQIDDFNRVAHIKQIDLASPAHATGMDNELGCFGDGHEVTGNLFMRDSDWSSLADLGAKEWND